MKDLIGRTSKALGVDDQVMPLVEKMRAFRDRKKVQEAHRSVEQAWVDPRIRFPAYASMDRFIDVDRLRALEPVLREKLAPRQQDDGKFWTGPYTLDLLDNRMAGSRLVELSKNRRGTSSEYADLDKAELWEVSEHAAAFPEVMDFIATMPFKSVGRMLIMYDFNGKRVPAHRDHDRTEQVHDFIWFRPNLKKPFFVMDRQSGEKKYFEGYSAWFDTVNQFHGADAVEGFSISLRVDGVFTDELRALIPVPDRNLASTSALWACTGDRAATSH
ncbi:hypothetical protein HMF7854_00230 [Sphingomonas ginkgonis]|uniref:Aspartyl/asparaginy/proline hydroxylase domain-containing protein n=1 Tax=Sphingomonas ginkgonis TaxID=2315330 RepID=A0A3S0EJY5_9SPHN|nr:hypothetical protein [Sphingomonas ginkgonis]RST29429.1 hypothetical protein HMF7854_00230 [Sphingomonas ginkgonis]